MTTILVTCSKTKWKNMIMKAWFSCLWQSWTYKEGEIAMSMCYWIIQGVGLDTDNIYNHIDKAKLAVFLQRQFPDDEKIARMVRLHQYNELDVEEYLGGDPFHNLGDLLVHCDVTDTLIYGDDGENGSYIYYPPSMPWERLKNDPRSIAEVHLRIIQAVKTIVSDLSDNEINSLIQDDLYIVGMG